MTWLLRDAAWRPVIISMRIKAECVGNKERRIELAKGACFHEEGGAPLCCMSVVERADAVRIKWI